MTTPDDSNILNENKGISNTINYNMVSLVCIIIFVISWVTNFGWFRFIFAIPMAIHAVVFYFANRSYHHHMIHSNKMTIANVLIYVTYLLAYILLPDGGDTSDSLRAVFGLIKDDKFLNIAGSVSEILLIINIILIVNRIVFTSKVKSKMKEQSDNIA